MRVLILGATGSLGPHLVSQALSRDHEVSVLVREPSFVQRHSPMDRFVTGFGWPRISTGDNPEDFASRCGRLRSGSTHKRQLCAQTTPHWLLSARRLISALNSRIHASSAAERRDRMGAPRSATGKNARARVSNKRCGDDRHEANDGQHQTDGVKSVPAITKVSPVRR